MNVVARDSLNISPVESPCTPSPSAEPLFKDENITVYAIPILPLSEPQEATVHSNLQSSEDRTETGQKRKREASPDLPGKRQALDGVSPSPSEQSTNIPVLLKGAAADEWKRQMIKLMFPGTNLKPERVPRDRDDPTPRPRKKDRKSEANREFSAKNQMGVHYDTF